jgi:hypothetical protein
MLEEKSNGCLSCGQDKGTRPKFCSRKCSVYFNGRKLGNGRSYTYYSKSPRNFFQSLLQRKGHDRQNLDLDYLGKLWEEQKGLCAISGVPMTHVRGSGKVMTNVSIDRIDSSIGYERGNVHLVCYVVNMMKHTMSVDQLVWWCEQVIENNRTNDNKMSNLKVQSPSKNRSFKRNSSAGRKT